MGDYECHRNCYSRGVMAKSKGSNIYLIIVKFNTISIRKSVSKHVRDRGLTSQRVTLVTLLISISNWLSLSNKLQSALVIVTETPTYLYPCVTLIFLCKKEHLYIKR